MKRLNSSHFKNTLRLWLGALGISLTVNSLPVRAAEIKPVVLNDHSMNVESSSWANWPQAPEITADSAILMDAESGVILYSKNIHKQQYPASTTKILTTLIAIEQCQMDEMVTFSYRAVHDIDPGSNHIAVDVGEQLPMEDCLKAILIRSANEISFAVGEHIAGESWQNFAPIMNERARELGALNSNFVNPNGLPNEEHVTTAYDLAMIGRAFFENEILCKMTLTKQLHLYPSDTQPDEIWENNSMAIIPGGQYEYPGLIGCKTGYTVAARSCLVSCAERNGMKLICVILGADAPAQYEETIALFDYGFHNFTKQNVAQNETHYTIDTDNFFYNNKDIFGSSKALLSLNNEDYVILPNTAQFTDTDSTISYQTDSPLHAAQITYTYQGVYVGKATLDFVSDQADYQFDPTSDQSPENATGDSAEATADSEPSFLFVNRKLLIILGSILIALLLLCILGSVILKNFQINLPAKGRRQQAYRRRRSTHRTPRPNPSAELRNKRRQQRAEARRRKNRARRH